MKSEYVFTMSLKAMKNKGFGHLKTRLFTIKTSKHVGFGGPWYIIISCTFFGTFLGMIPIPEIHKFKKSKPTVATGALPLLSWQPCGGFPGGGPWKIGWDRIW